MTREIKFRAWKKKKRIFIFWRNIFEGNDFWEDVNYPDTLPVMQFTGLEDKNGVEIYEGDIVESNKIMFNNLNRKFGVVVFDKDSFKINTVGLHILTSPPEEFEPEVIGNIYENPNLLKS